MLVVGAIGNAALPAYVPVLTGNAFNAMVKLPPDISVLIPLAITIGVSQIIRGVLQLGRNFGAELLAQFLERDIRDELYLSLLGKSMTFHNLQPVGDTMARATNDVREVNFMFNPGVNLVVGSFMFIVMPFSSMSKCTQSGSISVMRSRFCKMRISLVTSVPAFARKVLSGSLIAPSSSALWAIYFRTSGLALSIVPFEVMNATTPPVRTLSRAFAKK